MIVGLSVCILSIDMIPLQRVTTIIGETVSAGIVRCLPLGLSWVPCVKTIHLVLQYL